MSDQVPSLNVLGADYFRRWNNCLPSAGRLAELDTVIALILRNRPRYENVAQKMPAPLGVLSIPWVVIALIHYREADLDFRCHLFNGDPLSGRTVNEPKGQPAAGSPPFTWEESAWASLRYDRMDKRDYSTVAGICFALEDYNGWGYYHHDKPSPYLWAASNQQVPGKFTSDGDFSASQMDRQLGAITILKRMVTQCVIPIRATEVAPDSAPPALAIAGVIGIRTREPECHAAFLGPKGAPGVQSATK